MRWAPKTTGQALGVHEVEGELQQPPAPTVPGLTQPQRPHAPRARRVLLITRINVPEPVPPRVRDNHDTELRHVTRHREQVIYLITVPPLRNTTRQNLNAYRHISLHHAVSKPLYPRKLLPRRLMIRRDNEPPMSTPNIRRGRPARPRPKDTDNRALQHMESSMRTNLDRVVGGATPHPSRHPRDERRTRLRGISVGPGSSSWSGEGAGLDCRPRCKNTCLEAPLAPSRCPGEAAPHLLAAAGAILISTPGGSLTGR